MAVRGKSITVLGAGIGGLTAAIALARRGACVTVVEQAPELTEVGAGLQITPNGSAVLEALDLGRRIRAIGIDLAAVELKDYRGGDPVLRLDMSTASHRNNNPYLLVHRADMIEMLAASATRHGVSIVLGKKVTGVTIGFDQVTLPIEDGPQHTSKILVGADGVRSLTRQALNFKTPPNFTGHVAWRTTIDARFVPIYNMPPVVSVYMGPKKHMVTYPLRGGRFINVVGIEERETWAAEGWRHKGDPEVFRETLNGWAPELRKLLTVCEDVYFWGLFAYPVAETWSQGNATILGDALHPTLPYLAQGANMALEDAWVLAEEMDKHDDIQDAFTAYRKRRHRRVSKIVKGASKNTRVYHMANPAKRYVAHQAMRLAGRIAPDRILDKYNWLYGLDVTAGN